MLNALAAPVADDLKVCRAEAGADKMRAFTIFAHADKLWSRERHVVARLEVNMRGFDPRHVVIPKVLIIDS